VIGTVVIVVLLREKSRCCNRRDSDHREDQ
jgi:hypothetical protein